MKEQIEKTLSGLKDFQKKTVEYVYDQLYTRGRNRMLIADEVGLGKTIVTKGLLAKAYLDAFEKSKGKKPFKVVYVCSNQALAKQNLKKLNFTGDPSVIDYSNEDDRITALAYEQKEFNSNFNFSIKAFTPATSFDNKTSAGKADERFLLYRLLYSYKDLWQNRKSLKWILKGKVGQKRWDEKIDLIEKEDKSLRNIRSAIFSRFRKNLEEQVDIDILPKCYQSIGISYPIKLWTILRKLCEIDVDGRNWHKFDFYNELISELRFRLSKACLEFLEADVFVLDEFQRFKQLIDYTEETENLSPALELARDIFSIGSSKVIMLSATPFKPYTNDFDAITGEVHHEEFETVLRFLIGENTDEFWHNYEKDRKAFFEVIRHPNKLKHTFDQAYQTKSNLENHLRSALSRTERFLVTNSGSNILNTHHEPLEINKEDIQEFIAFDQVTKYLNEVHDTNLNIPMEYVKSCPYPLSFLDSYAHKKKLEEKAKVDPELIRLLTKKKDLWLDLNSIDQYKELVPKRGKSVPNAKIRLLLKETIESGGWKYLWIPSSLPYYEFQGAFKGSSGYSKTLLFSSWKMVPKMVASLVSYEAERLTVGNKKTISEREWTLEKRQYFHPPKKKRTPIPQLTFKIDVGDQGAKQMNNFLLLFPSLFLANLYDPSSNLFKKSSLRDIKEELKEKLIQRLLSDEIRLQVLGEGNDQDWEWCAPLLLEKISISKDLTKSWFEKGMPSGTADPDSETPNDQTESSGKQIHFDTAKDAYLSKVPLPLPYLNESKVGPLAEMMVDLVLGSPAICSLRALSRLFGSNEESIGHAFHIASAFLTLYNKPESIATLRLFTSDKKNYWEQCLQYGIDGNIQAMLDEYFFMLKDCENLSTSKEITEFVTDVLSIRTASIEAEGFSEFKKKIEGNKTKRNSMRAHFAIDFGSQKFNTAKSSGRSINVRQAFNSPFRPFVLASTSVGQEGLDFHFYCKKIFHWNLPSNPIDFEQREGRINRYKGLIIRQNLAAKYKEELKGSSSIWEEIFTLAESEKAKSTFPCDLVPYWHTEPLENLKIERFVPLYPYSRDIERYQHLIKVLAFYRLTFGQPRQDELIEALNAVDLDSEEKARLKELMIELSPVVFY
ncbi:helicase-related protein [Algoriphagus taiwanensis]|uniref:Helicase n=1 Tax=Algoriphagus taiwanensis TaxID=1445656 RepID=A0ABQ6PXF8_9BACT|nr:helicase [Algoriphagus taiwanensis]